MTETIVKNRFSPDEYTERLESMKAEIFFPNFRPPENIETIINELSNQAALRKLAPQDLSEYAIMLASYATYLSSQENRLTAFINWCEGNIKFVIGKRLDDVPEWLGNYYPTLDTYIRSHEENAISLENRKSVAQVKLDSIKFIAQRLQYLSETIKTLIFEKGKLGRNLNS